MSESVKKPNKTETYTKEQIKHLARCMQDPKYFAENFFYVQTPTSGRQILKLYDFQSRFLDVLKNNKYVIALMSRQMGKTTCSSVYLLWRALFKPDQTILVVAHNLNQALEITGRIRFAYEELPSWLKAGVVEYNKGSIVFDNGSRIISRAASTHAARGLSISLLYMDELSFIRRKMQEEFWAAVSPTLATGGDCIITSTPGSDEDLFANLWRQAENIINPDGSENPLKIGKNGFRAFKATWREHPERDEKWAERERAKIGDAKFLREFECEFITHTDTLIDQLKLSTLVPKQPIETIGQLRWYTPIKENVKYFVALDPSMGIGSDFSAISVFSYNPHDKPTLEQVAEWRSNNQPVKKQTEILMNILMKIFVEQSGLPNQIGEPDIYWTFENNSVGEAVNSCIQEIGIDNFQGYLINEPKIKGRSVSRNGLTTTKKTKLQACSKLKHLIESDSMIVYSQAMIREMKYFESSGVGYEAKSGETDDLISTMLLVVRMMQIVSEWDRYDIKNIPPQAKNSVKEFKDSNENNMLTNVDEENAMPFIFSVRKIW